MRPLPKPSYSFPRAHLSGHASSGSIVTRHAVPLSRPVSWQSPSVASAVSHFASPPEASGVSLGVRRCVEKGCVFPAASTSADRCIYHDRERREPALFRSQQPSRLLLERAQFGVAASEEVSMRSRDRQRLAQLWQDFLLDGIT